MKAVGLYKYLPIDDPESLLDLEVPKPEPAGRDLLVRVKAVSVNPVDTKVRRSNRKEETQPRILGWDAAGVVEAAGPDVSLFRAGDEVYYAGDITRPGSNAEFQLVDERIVGRKPRTLSYAEAAALPLTAITAYEAFFDRLGIDPAGGNRGQTLLIIGGAGGVGSIGIQLAKLAGLKVIATASRTETRSWVQELGADQVIDHSEPLRPQIDQLGHRWVDYIAIFNDTDLHWNAACDLIKPQGRFTSIVENKNPLKQDELKRKSAAFVWEFMFTRSMFETPDMIEQHRLLKRVSGWVEEGELRTTLKETVGTLTAANLKEAHRKLEAGSTIGKLVLTL
ncbi:MAG: zinc-binding alcohol dehydrogenase family protein [Blastocatellia bacterium]|nr:zinc-binding alcohol dehydrogenase family protein [Blastocatellia bacterium]